MRGNPFVEAELKPVCAAVTVARKVLRGSEVEMAVKSCVSSARIVSSSSCHPSKGTEFVLTWRVTTGGAGKPLCRRWRRPDQERGGSRSAVMPARRRLGCLVRGQGGLIAC